MISTVTAAVTPPLLPSQKPRVRSLVVGDSVEESLEERVARGVDGVSDRRGEPGAAGCGGPRHVGVAELEAHVVERKA
jgi:hypothetical protein